MQPITREIIERRQAHIRWGAVFAGAVFSVGLWLLLQMLGTGIGLAAVDPKDTGSLRSAGIGTGIWSLIAPLIAMFVGGIFAGRLAGTVDRKVGGMHGAVMWALTSILGLMMLASVIMTIIGGVVSAGGAAAGMAGSAVTQAVGGIEGGDVMSALGLNANDLLGPVNQRLQAQGKPPITADQLKRALQASVQHAVREGKLDREMLVEDIANNTSLSREDAQDLANQIEMKYQSASSQLQQKGSEVKQQATEAGLTAADKTGKVLLYGGIGMLLSLIAAVGGGLLGAGRRRERDREVVDTVPRSGPPSPIIPAEPVV